MSRYIEGDVRFRQTMDRHSLSIHVGEEPIGNLLWHDNDWRVDLHTRDPFVAIPLSLAKQIVNVRDEKMNQVSGTKTARQADLATYFAFAHEMDPNGNTIYFQQVNIGNLRWEDGHWEIILRNKGNQFSLHAIPLTVFDACLVRQAQIIEAWNAKLKGSIA